MDGALLEQCPDIALTANQSFTMDEKSVLANSSFENSPSLDREKFLKYSARSRDEFWDALSSNYDYLMDDGLIATCREASSDLSLDDEREIPEACFWSFTQFIEQFKWLHDLLHNIQVAKEGGCDSSGTKIIEDKQKVAYLCKLFNDQAQRLSKRYPDMRDEVHRHLNRLNNKWKAVEQSINPTKVKSPSKDSVFHEISLRMRSLRKWLRDVEGRLSPINPNANWTLENLERKYKEGEELQKEIQVKGKCISSLLKLCDHLKGNVQIGQNSSGIQWDSEQVRKVAQNLEHKWHSLWLDSLQDTCILEDLIEKYATDGDLEKSFSEEPLKKYPRLSSNCKELLLLENELKDKIEYKMDDTFIDNLFEDQMQMADLSPHRDEYTLKNDKGVMVGDTGIAELKAECQKGTGKFEIIQDVGYSSETSAHLSNDEKLDSPEIHLVKNIECETILPTSNVSFNLSISNQVGSLCDTPNKVYLPPDKYPSISLKHLHLLSDDKQFLNSKYGSCKSVPDSFYKVTSVDEEVLNSISTSQNENVPSELLVTENGSNDADKPKLKEISNKISNLNLESNSNLLSTEQNDKKNFLVKNCFPSECHQPSYSVTKRTKRGLKSSVKKSSQPDDLWKKTNRVQEWLSKCESVDGDDGTSDDNVDGSEKSSKTDWLNKTADSSCDASGEYTTTESDSEKSNMSDINNSVTMSQSFTGSIETVIPVVPEENGVVHSDKAGSIDPSAGGVRMRKKKRISRERPWSVTDVHQTLISSVFPHSTSESALDLLCSPQDSKTLGSKKFTSDTKRLSLTDVSAFSCPSIKSLKLNLNSKTLNSKLNFSTEKPPSRRKKVSVSDKGSDKCDLAPSSASQKQISSVENSDASKSKTSISENRNTKVPLNECNSTPLVSEIEKSETTVNVEDPESISDVAWDEYQDPPYLSEPYSEQTVDEDEVKKLINFGDDYRAVLGSYSDASSVSLKAPPLKAHKTKSKLWRKGSSQESRDSLISDSNSDSEDFHNVLKTSKHALQFVSNSLMENVQQMTVFSAEFAELFATCQTNLCHLHAIHEGLSSGCELDALSKEDIQKLKELIKDWESLRVELIKLSHSDGEQKPKNADLEAATIDVHRSLAALEEKLSSIALSITNAGVHALSLNQLKTNIKTLQAAFPNLQDTKECVLSVSARILRLIDEGGGPSIAILRESVTKLYRQWEEVYEMNCSQLTKLQALQSRWHEPTENEMNSSSETTVQWQPVQVGGNLPTPEVSTEEFFQNTAAEVQVADQHDVLFEIEESAKASIQCVIEDDFSDPVHLLCPPVLNIKKNLGIQSNKSESANSKKASCFWRTLRATVPIQLALISLYCMSCLMEPNCCDNMNNYDFSLSPHLRYFRGPPPV